MRRKKEKLNWPFDFSTAKELKEFFKNKLHDTEVFGGTYKKLTPKTSLVLQADLANSDI